MKIKLAHIINFMSPAGKEIGIVKLLNKLDPQQFESTLIVIDKVYDLLNLDTDRTRLIELHKKRGNDFTIPYRLYKLFKKEQFHIVHTHAWGTLVEGTLAAKMGRVPVVIHGEHGTFHKDFKRKLIQKIFFNWTDNMTSVSEVLANEIARTIGVKKNKFHTILNGVDVERFSPDSTKREDYRKKLGFEEKAFILGTVGRPKPVKNQQMMIRALKIILPKFPHTHIVLIGDTPLDSHRQSLEALAVDLGVAEHVHFLGIQEDIPGWLNAFDVFVLPSLREGCSNVLQEAMATGLAIVASRVGGNPELIEHEKTGLLFESDNLSALKQQLERLILDDKKRRKLGEAARNEAIRKFSLNRMVDNYRDFYLSIVQNNMKNKNQGR